MQQYQTEHGSPKGYRAVELAFKDGSVFDADREHIMVYLMLIGQNVTGDDAVQSRDMVQAITLNHLLLKRHIEEVERRSNRTQWLVITLAVASLIATAVQIGLAIYPATSVTKVFKPDTSSKAKIKAK